MEPNWQNSVVVSIIMTTYNHEEYIRQAIESALCQKLEFECELIIGDDASTDSTAKIIDEIADRFPDKVIHISRKENIGASANFYDLLYRANGRYIAILDGDDYWCSEDKLQKQVDFLDTHHEFIGCTHFCCMVDQNGEKIDSAEPDWMSDLEVYTLDDFKGFILPGQPSTMVFRNIFKEPLHDYSIIRDSHPMISDRTLTVCLAANGSFKKLGGVMSCYRVSHQNNLTAALYEHSVECGSIDIELSKKIEEYLSDEFKIMKSFRLYRFKIRVKLVIKRLLPEPLLKKLKRTVR